MREIKFRAWNVENNEMVNFSNDKLCNDQYQMQHLAMLMRGDYGDVLMQYTGLTDCNGVKIFEGDIVSISEEDEDSCCGRRFNREPVKIVWRKLQWMFDNGKEKVIGEKDWTDYASLSTTASHNVDIEVIGNIHQNPELLERNHA